MESTIKVVGISTYIVPDVSRSRHRIESNKRKKQCNKTICYSL